MLCPEELCLGPMRLTATGIVGLTPSSSDFSIWTSGDLEKGTRFVPWKGTVRSDKLPVHDKLPEFDVSYSHKNLLASTFMVIENCRSVTDLAFTTKSVKSHLADY